MSITVISSFALVTVFSLNYHFYLFLHGYHDRPTEI